MKISKTRLMGYFDSMCQTTHDCISTLAWGREIASGLRKGGGPESICTPFCHAEYFRGDIREILTTWLIVRILSIKENGGFVKARSSGAMFPKRGPLTTSHKEMIFSNSWISISYFNVCKCFFFFFFFEFLVSI